MLKGAVGAAQRVTKDLNDIEAAAAAAQQINGQQQQNSTNNPNPNNQTTDYFKYVNDIPKMKHRCEITSNWLCSQFRGVLERADAANVEIARLAVVISSTNNNNNSNTGNMEGDQHQQSQTANPNTNAMSVEELIYNHALASGRDGAVKHLLGQYEAARSCYRSAGLLAETLLMEVNDIGVDDRKILEGYVDGFAARITELDQLMFQQSRMTLSSNTTSANNNNNNTSSSRGSGIVVGLIGPPPAAAASSPFVVGSPR